MSLQRDVDCPICLSQLLFSRAGCTLMTCCGNFMHDACSFGLDTSSTSNTIKDHCPLCRADRLVEHSTEMIERVRTHSQANKPWAFYQLGLFYRDGKGVTKSLLTAKTNLETAANLGYRFAQLTLGNMYFKGLCNETINLERAKEYYEAAAVQEDSMACITLANMYMNGKGVVQNDEKANHYLTIAADKNNNPIACFILGMRILTGDGCRMSLLKARPYLTKCVAAKTSDGDEAIVQYQKQASAFLKQTNDLIKRQFLAAQGDAQNQFNLGSSWGKGQAGLTKSNSAPSYDVAMFWYAKAVAQGFGQAIPMLAMCSTQLEKNGIKPIPDDSKFCSMCASLTPRREPPIKIPGWLNCKCKIAAFCSRECQTAAWKGHRQSHKAELKKQANVKTEGESKSTDSTKTSATVNTEDA